MKKNDNKIILNCLPPTDVFKPSIACEILKSHLQYNGFNNVDIVYWNFIFYETFKKEVDTLSLVDVYDDTNFVLPFLNIIAEEANDSSIKNRLLLKIQNLNPSYKILGKNYIEKIYYDLIETVLTIINNKLDEIISEDIIVFGISAKYDGWIPGYILAREFKKKKPNIKCVIGGFENYESANAVFKKFSVFDFAIWGEGEIPLLKLCESLVKDENIFNSPRLLYRENDTIIKSKVTETNSYLNFNEYHINYDDYFKSIESKSIESKIDKIDKNDISIPIETSRGCRWNKCNFCALNWGNLYRVKDNEKIINEIRENYKRYDIKRYFFVDNDIVGRNKEKFNKLLNLLIKLSLELNTDFKFHADVLHLNLDSNLIKKMSLAGFKGVQIGYEAVSDSMLKKLNKSTTFADNLLFIKFAKEYDIVITITGLIIGIPNENEQDIFESSNNLHYLRFFLNNSKHRPFGHVYAELMLFYNTNFWNMLSKEERYTFNHHPSLFLLPSNFISNSDDKFSIFGLSKIPVLKDSWDVFLEISKYYEKTDYEYYILENDGIVNYIEYRNNLKIEAITFYDPLYWDVLTIANNKVISLNKMVEEISKKHVDIEKPKLIEVIKNLESKYLLYSNSKLTKIVSIINTDRLS